MSHSWRFVLALVALAAATGCPKKKKGEEQQKSAGVRIADDGEVTKVSPSPDGRWVAFLGQIEKPKELGVPDGAFLGMLEVVPADGKGNARRLLGGVTNLQGGFAFSPDSSQLAALKGYRFASHSGTLEVMKVEGGEPTRLADEASSFLFSPDSKRLAWVAGGGAFLANVDGTGPRKLADGAATIDFSRDGKRLLVRKTGAAGGDLLLTELESGAQRTLAKAVGDYLFSPDGAEVAFTTRSQETKGGWTLMSVPAGGGEPRQVGEAVSRFVFSPDSKWLAFVAGITPSRPFGDLWVAPAGGNPGVRVGERVEEFRFAPNSGAVAFLERWDPNGHSGTLSVQKLPMAEKAQTLSRPVMHFEWSPQGGYLAFTSITLKPSYSVDMQLVHLADLKAGEVQPDGGTGYASGARKVQSGVYSYEFLTEGLLLYRTECIMEGRACDLYEVPTDKPALPARITGGVWRFQVSKDGSRMLVTYPRVDSETTCDLGAINIQGYGGVAGIDKRVEPGAAFLDPAGKRVAYGVIAKGRNGVYVADIPLPDPAAPIPADAAAAPGVKATYDAKSGAADAGPAH